MPTRRIRNTARLFASRNLNGRPQGAFAGTSSRCLIWTAGIRPRITCCNRNIIEAYDTYKFWNVYSEVHNSVCRSWGALSDIIRTASTHIRRRIAAARRSCQTGDVIHIVRALTRGRAVLSFTAESLQYLPASAPIL